MHYSVTTITEGALDSDEEFEDASEADEYAARQRLALIGLAVSDWQIYVLPHHCSSDGECDCAQWATSHHPAFSSDEV